MKLSTIFSYLLLCIAFMSVNLWSKLPIGNFTTYFLFGYSIILIIFYYKKKNDLKSTKVNTILLIYLLWALIGIVRGMFVAENYWEWKAWSTNSLALMLPILVYMFINPNILQKSLFIWVKYALPLFLIYAAFLIGTDTYGFYLAPIWLLGLFLPVLNSKWRMIIVLFLVLLLTANLGNRSTVIKTVGVLFILIYYYSRKYLTTKLLKYVYLGLFILPIILLIFGLNGTFNVFDMDKYINTTDTKLTADTRSFIYEEQITSAINNNYVILGRTPARGFDSIFGEQNADIIKSAGNTKGVILKPERNGCEVVHLNIFNYLGVIGVILYSLLYLQSAYLAIRKSNSDFLKMIGLYIAFRWAFGWVEDFNRFDIMNISLWMMIAMGYSSQFRKMNNKDITIWIRGVFDIKYVKLYNDRRKTKYSSINNLPQS